uniref:Uncharacterized protein n=1 Tax=Oryza sativa subsp. japonica TaxID=39947 RepID=Q6ZDL6_ORYSJ|nr:hypothetical protein [Oryza sativa Japonica Group]
MAAAARAVRHGARRRGRAAVERGRGRNGGEAAGVVERNLIVHADLESELNPHIALPLIFLHKASHTTRALSLAAVVDAFRMRAWSGYPSGNYVGAATSGRGVIRSTMIVQGGFGFGTIELGKADLPNNSSMRAYYGKD